MATYFAAVHSNSVLLLALGLPFDRALPWHKALALCSLYNGLLHATSYYVAGAQQWAWTACVHCVHTLHACLRASILVAVPGPHVYSSFG